MHTTYEVNTKYKTTMEQNNLLNLHKTFLLYPNKYVSHRTYSDLTFGLQLLSNYILHFFDIATDISILIDLKEKTQNISMCVWEFL